MPAWRRTRSKRLVRFMAKESIWKNPVAGPLMTRHEAHPGRP